MSAAGPLALLLVVGGLVAVTTFLVLSVFVAALSARGRASDRRIEEALAQAQPGSHAVVLAGPGPRKILAIKLVRQLTRRPLKEARALVDGAPAVLRDGLDEATAQALAELLREGGLEVEVGRAPSAGGAGADLAVRGRVGGRRCPFCQADVAPEEPQVVCADCLARHHRERWDDHAQCASCGGTTRFAELERTEGRPSPSPRDREKTHDP